jgi:sugar diacid utilization regulator
MTLQRISSEQGPGLNGDLLAGDDRIARQSFRDAMNRRQIHRGAKTTVLALLATDETGDRDLDALTGYVTSIPSPRLLVAGWCEGALILLTNAHRRLAAIAALQKACIHLGVEVAAVGTSALNIHEGHLRPAATRAATAARISARVPQTEGSGDIADLGMWALLDSVPFDISSLAVFSPAASLLCLGGDDIQRETVETYLDVACNARAACALLHIHRTTLYYRLDNLPDCVREALDDGPARSALHLCLKLFRYHLTATTPNHRGP